MRKKFKIKKILMGIILGIVFILGANVSVYADEIYGEDVINDDPEYKRATGEIDAEFYDDFFRMQSTEQYVHNSRYSDYIIKNGIDVSKYQGVIDWNKVKSDGVEFAIIRVGYRGYTTGKLVNDEYFISNIVGAKAAGIKVGVYIFSQAITEKEAVEEAEYVLNQIADYELDLPVVIDYEYVSNGEGRLYNAYLSVEQATAICKAFCRRVENAGYTGMVYANSSMLKYQLDADSISNEYKIWLAHYTSQTNYSGEYDFWQYTSSGSVNGINGRVDCNFYYIKDTIDIPQVLEEGIYTIASGLHQGLVLDVQNASFYDGANIQLYTRNNTRAQNFMFKYLENGYYKIICIGSAKVLEVLDGNVQQNSYTGAQNQKWKVEDLGNGEYKIVSAIGNKCLDVSGGNAINGSNIQVWEDNNTKAQRFALLKYDIQILEDGVYSIRTCLNINKTIDIANGSMQNYANVQLYDFNNTEAQKFHVRYLGNGFYSIKAMHSGKSLDVSNGSNINGTNVQQYISNNTDSQKWIIQTDGDGTYYISSSLSAGALDVCGGKTKNATNIQIWEINGTLSQKFLFKK